MFCPKCGNNLKDGTKFCSKCGAEIIPPEPVKETRSNLQVQIEPRKEKRGKNQGLVIVVTLCITVVAGVMLAGVLIYRKTSEPVETVGFSTQKEAVGMEEESKTGNPDFVEDETIDIGELLGWSTPAPTTAAAAMAAPSVEAETETPMQTTTEVTALDSISFQLLEEVPDLSGYQRVGVARAGASSNIVQEGNQNGPEMVLDGDEVTSWQEGTYGPGIGDYIYYELDQKQSISYLTFKLGNWRNDKYFYSNNRPRTLSVTLDDYTFQITFPDEKREYFVQITPSYPASYIEFQIDEVYQGTSYDDTCIAEIGMYSRMGD